MHWSTLRDTRHTVFKTYILWCILITYQNMKYFQYRQIVENPYIYTRIIMKTTKEKINELFLVLYR